MEKPIELETPIELVNQIRVRVLLRLTQLSYTMPDRADQLALCKIVGRLKYQYGYRGTCFQAWADDFESYSNPNLLVAAELAVVGFGADFAGNLEIVRQTRGLWR